MVLFIRLSFHYIKFFNLIQEYRQKKNTLNLNSTGNQVKNTILCGYLSLIYEYGKKKKG